MFQCRVDVACALGLPERVLYYAGCGVGLFEALKELRGAGEEDTFSFRLQAASSNMHFQPKSCKVVVDEFHPTLQILPCLERKGAVVHI